VGADQAAEQALSAVNIDLLIFEHCFHLQTDILESNILELGDRTGAHEVH
jgi:hypothetical protein